MVEPRGEERRDNKDVGMGRMPWDPEIWRKRVFAAGDVLGVVTRESSRPRRFI
jgi:hypothetical protein